MWCRKPLSSPLLQPDWLLPLPVWPRLRAGSRHGLLPRCTHMHTTCINVTIHMQTRSWLLTHTDFRAWLVLLIVYFCVCMFSAQISMSAVCPATCVSTSVLTIQEVTLVSVHKDISSRQTGCVKVWQSTPFLPPINQFFIYFLCSFVYYLSHTPVSVFQHNKLPLHKLFEDNWWLFFLSSSV